MTGINTNVMSVNAQRNLSASADSLATSVQRLSSGLRVNSAKDDAAGLAISERMGAQIRGMNMAIRNANDGISLAQTAEGALAGISSNLQRIRELAVQAANATLSGADRTALDAEAQALLDEIDRVGSNTKFNGAALLNGTYSGNIQVGANSGDTISLAITTNATKIGFGFTAAAAQNAVSAQAAVTAAVDAANTVSQAAVVAQDAVVAQYGNSAQAAVAAQAIVTSGTTTLAQDAVTAQDAFTGRAALDITSVANAEDALQRIDFALGKVSDSRAQLGAMQSRFSSAISNLQTGSENLNASRSRIVDADFAQETANLSRAQVLQQAGMAMVAQANQMPQGVMALLR